MTKTLRFKQLSRLSGQNLSPRPNKVSMSEKCWYQHPRASLPALSFPFVNPRSHYEQIGRHVHNPCTDLIVIVDVTVSSSAVSSARNILWLLSSAFSRFENGALNPPELVGLGARNMKKMASKPLLKMKQITERPHSTGVVLCLPRLQLQRWLLAEGRAWRGDRGKLWSPPWLEFEVDAPPLLPVHFELEAVTNSNGGINHSGSDRFESNASSTSVWS